MEKNLFDLTNRISKTVLTEDNVSISLYDNNEEIVIDENGRVNYPNGTLLNCCVGNVNYIGVVIDGKVNRVEGTEASMETFKITTEKFFIVNDKPVWKKVGEGDPNNLIQEGLLKEHDIIRFKNMNGDFIPCIPELEIGDVSGVFYIGRSVNDLESSMYDIFNHAIDIINDDEDDDQNEFDYSEGDLEIIPATPIIEYLRMYGGTIRAATKAVDIMDAEWEKLAKE